MLLVQELVSIVESSIEILMDTFLKTPYLFYTESDLHCFLYDQLYRKMSAAGFGTYETLEKRTSILLHKEYPTKERYSRKRLAVDPKGKRGHFDLCVWNPNTVKNRLFRARRTANILKEQHTFVAIEFDLIEQNNGFWNAMHHLQWDFMKLVDRANEVKYGYLLIFIRDWIHRDLFLQKIPEHIRSDEDVVVLCVESSLDRKLANTLSKKAFLSYEYFWKPGGDVQCK